MSTDPHDQMLQRLRTVPLHTTAPGLGDLQLRVRRRRRRHARRRVLTAGGVAVVLGAAGFASPHLPWLSGPTTGAVAAPTCRATTGLEVQTGGPAFWVREKHWDDHAALRAALRLLPDQVPSLVGLHDDAVCPPALPTAVLYDHAGGRGITIWSGIDDAADLVGRQPGARHTTVGGRPALITATPSVHYVAWTTADGVPRYARAHGMSADELRATLSGLQLTRTGIVEGSVPSGYRSAAVPDGSQAPVELTWIVAYGSRNAQGAAPGDAARLEITAAPSTPIESVLSLYSDETFLEVDGHTAIWSGDPVGPSRLIWTTDEARYQLSVPGGTLKEMVRMAQSLTPAADDDPRLTGAQHHGWW